MPVLQFVENGRCEINSFQLDKWNKKLPDLGENFFIQFVHRGFFAVTVLPRHHWSKRERIDENEPGTARLMGQDQRLKPLIRQTSNQRNKAALIGGGIADTSDTCIYCVSSSLLLSTSSVGHFASIVQGDFSPEWVSNPKQIHNQSKSGDSEKL